MCIKKPQGFEINAYDSHVCNIRKALNGFKQETRAWNYRIDKYLQNVIFSKYEEDPKLYYMFVRDDLLVLVLYIDDMFLIGSNKFHWKVKVKYGSEVRDEGHWCDALLLGVGSFLKTGGDFPWTG